MIHVAAKGTSMPTPQNPARTRRPRTMSFRRARRGTVLVVVLGILVVLGLIAIAFGFIVHAEYESSLNALSRFRALSAARDGEAYAIGRLRAIAANQHWEPEGSWSFNTSFANPDARGRQGPGNRREAYEDYLRRYARNARLSAENSQVMVSFSRGGTTNDKGIEDDNWVDLNGDGKISTDETTLAQDIISRGREGLRNVSYFVGDGVDLNIRRGSSTAGTSRELGDRARLKIIDTNSQFPINAFVGDELSYRLQVLGTEIAKLASDQVNPFPEDIANDIVRFKEEAFGRIGTKDALIPFMLRSRASAQTIDFTLDLIAVRSWPDDDGSVFGTTPYFGNKRFDSPQTPVDPERRRQQREREEQRRNDVNSRNRRSHQDLLGKGEHAASNPYDGFPHIEPGGGRERRSPLNVNTVQLPVLVALLAGLEAEPRYLYYPNTDTLVEDDAWLRLLDFTEGKRLSNPYSTTDAGRQPNYDGQRQHMFISDPSMPNTANYQIITVGPLAHEVKPIWKTTGGGASEVTNPWFEGHHAYNIASRIIKEREERGPFRSWMDFDYRICHNILLGFQGDTSGIKDTADLVRANRGNVGETVNLADMPKGSGRNDRHLLPDPSSLRHPLAGVNDSAKHSYTPAEFDAWYWRACVDMIRCNFNPNGYYNKSNPEAAAYTVVDSTDMRVQSVPMCFSTMGTYEVVSQGEITARRVGRTVGSGTSSNLRLDYPVARRTFRSIVELYRTVEHTTQQHFVTTVDRTSFGQDQSGRTSSGGGQEVNQISAPVSLSSYGTTTYPNSIDLGMYDFSDKLYTAKEGRAGSPRGLKGRDGASAIGEPLHGGYYSTAGADNRFGHVALYPQDRSPNKATQSNPEGLNFWAQYNVSLEARRDGTATGVGNNNIDGHVPYSVNKGKGSGGDVLMSRSWNSAYPDPNRLDWKEEGWQGFEAHARRGNADAARHANLRPDGVRMSSWSYNPAFSEDAGSGINPEVTYTGQDRIVSRLALLIYRAGQNSNGDTPFAPIAGLNPDPQQEDLHGNDFMQHIIRRMTGADPASFALSLVGGNQGTDRANIALQNDRQQRTNFPYYEGWVDFWIKWELPPQGKSGGVACAGEIDPGSGNFSGLIGATSYGRFEPTLTPSTTRGDGSGVDRNNLSANNDFEGAQFFLFKEPGGRIRATQIYFNRAYTVRSADWRKAQGAIGATVQGGATPIGSNARIEGRVSTSNTDADGNVQTVPDEYISCNDIASGRNSDGILDMGFSFARNESYFDLNQSDNRQEHKLITHNWYRLSLKYRSNSRHSGGVDPERAEPHELYIDGRKVLRRGPLLPVPQGSLNAINTRGVNTGEITNENGQLTVADFNPPAPGLAPPPFFVQRSATVLGEVDPGDKLTIGCVYRQSVIEDRAVTGSGTSTRLFRFEENMIAPANATIDDVRIYRNLAGTAGFTGVISESDYSIYSRYYRSGGPNTNGEIHERGMYENGFLALQSAGGRTTGYTYPVRVGSLMWTESRPVWDPYKRERFDQSANTWANAPQIQMCYEIHPDVSQMSPNGAIAAVDLGTMNSTSRDSPNYWLNGGMALTPNEGTGRKIYIENDFSSQSRGIYSFFRYQAWFVAPGTSLRVLNTTPILEDVRLTLLTPPRRLYSEEIFQ